MQSLKRAISKIWPKIAVVSAVFAFLFIASPVHASTLWDDNPTGPDTIWTFTNDGGTTVGGGNFQAIMNYGANLDSIAGSTVTGFAVYMPNGGASRYVTYAQANHSGPQNLGIFECNRNGAGVPTNGDCSQSPGAYGNFYFLSSSGWSGIYADGDWLVVPLTTTFTARTGYTLVVSYFYDANNDSVSYSIGGTNSGACSQWNIRENSSTQNTCASTTLKKPKIIIYGSTFTPPPPPQTDFSTHIIDFAPANNATTTNPVTFSLDAYVAPEDIGQFIGVKFTLHNIDQNVLLLSAFSPSDIYFLDGFNATTSGAFHYSTTTTIGEGNYRVNAILERSYLGGWIVNPFSPINEDLSHQFIVCGGSDPACAGTFIGNMSQNGFNELNAIFASTTATSTSAVAQNCNPLGSFDIVKCGAFLFIPGGDYLDTTIKGLKDGVLTRVPWGYLTRVYNIWNSSATTTLPSFTVHVVTGPGDGSNTATTSLSFDPGDMIAGAGTLLESIKDPINGKSPKDVFGPLVQLALAIAVLFTIISDLTGSHRHHSDADTGENKQKKLS